ncbi:MAG: hypothetical protein WBE44_21255 [Terriglobales bacterium]|jgi:hypothetical protein
MSAKNPRRRALKQGRGPVGLTAELEKSLSAYASAAVAAGVSLAAMAGSAQAKIVYTPAHTTILANERVSIDLNHDGIADFGFYNLAGSSFAGLSVGCALHSTFKMLPPKGAKCRYQTNQVWGRGMVSGRFASALPVGFAVRASKPYFQSGNYPFGAEMGGVGVGRYGHSSNSGGQWLYATHRYLGLQFVILGKVHYGWARLNVTLKHGQIIAVLTGYAYETIPNKPIITGKTKGPDVITLDPATLGHLAVGATQIPAWRGARNGSAALQGLGRSPGQDSQTAP